MHGVDAQVAAAVQMLGEWAHLDLLAAVAGLKLAAAAAALVGLERAGLVEGAAPALMTAAGLTRSPLTALASPTRARMHARAATELTRRGADAAEICAHLLLAPGQGSAANVRTLRTFAARQARVGQTAAAVELLTRALREPPPAQELPAVLLELADALIAEGRHERALQAALQAREGSQTLAQEATAETAIFRAQIALGEVEQGLSRMLSEIRRIEVLHAELALQMECQLLTASALDARIMEAGLRRHREQAVDESLPSSAAYLLAAGQVLAMGGSTTASEAVALVRRGLRLHPEELDDPEPVIRTVWLLFRADERDEAQRVIGAARARRSGAAPTPVFEALEGLLRVRWGSVKEGADRLRGALAEASARRSALTVSAALAFLAIALLEADQLGALERLLAEHDPDGQSGNPFCAVALVVRGRLHLQADRPREALRDLMAVEERKASLGLTNPAGFHHIEPAVEALLSLGEAAQAKHLAQLNLQRAESWGAPITVALARSALARCMPPEQGVEQMRSSLEALRDGPASVAGAQIMLDLGRILIAAGRREDARERFRDALDGAARLCAQRLRRESHTALKEIGARPRRAHSHGVQALTDAERRVAGLAAAGLSNRQAADRLHLSIRTVENHLRHVYAKLRTDRAGLALALRESRE